MTKVRELRHEDRVAWAELWAGYLRFYRAEVAPEVTEQTCARMTERRDGCFGLAVEADDGTLAGFTHCVLHPSTWSRGGTCYLEDLYVDPGHRGTGVARALIENCGRAGPCGGRRDHVLAHTGVQRSGSLALRHRRAADVLRALRALARVSDVAPGGSC
jgi:GNAT superfamily N-acetyltransferase